MENINIGDVVFLKSGGIPMTVTAINEEHKDMAEVCFYDPNNTHNSFNYGSIIPIIALTKDKKYLVKHLSKLMENM